MNFSITITGDTANIATEDAECWVSWVSLQEGFTTYTCLKKFGTDFLMEWANEWFRVTIDRIESQEFVFFTRGDNLSTLNKVMLYIQGNEQTRKIKIVTVSQNLDSEVIEKLKKDIEFFDREYTEIEIEFLSIKGDFGPELIQDLSKQWNIPVNFMFIGSPGDHFPYRVEQLGGVRLII